MTAVDTGIPQAQVAAAPARTRPFYWSVRRELWEHRSIYLAPAIVAGVIIFGFLIRLARLPQFVRDAAMQPWWKQQLQLALPFAIAALAVLVTGAIVAMFYCLSALNNERRDRSILFWKSLPVSDTTAVLAKTFIPMIVVPAVALVIAFLTQLVMLLVGGGAVLASGQDAGALWTHWPLARMSLALVYIVVTATLWHAPIYGWLLLVSAWAKRMTFLWAVLIPVGLSVLEKIALDTDYVGRLINYRVKGFVNEAFLRPPRDSHSIDLMALATPAHFFSTPGLWIGLAAAAAFVVGAIWLRRDRDPV